MSEQKNMVNIGGLWLNRSQSGDVYFSGYLNGAKLLIFKNNFKEKDTHPDYVMYVTPPNKKPDDAPSADEFEASLDTPQTDTSDIPF